MSKDKNNLQDSNLMNIKIPAVDALIGKLIGDKLEEMTSSLTDEQVTQLVRKLFQMESEEAPIAKAASKKKKRK